MITKIIKRDGREVPFNIEKITNAIYKAAQAIGGRDYSTALTLSEMVADRLDETYKGRVPTVEQVQDCVEKVLVETGHARTAKEYILYRAERTRVREMNTHLMKTYEQLTFPGTSPDAASTDTAADTMYRYGEEGAKQFYSLFVLDPTFARAHESGDIFIHDLEAYGYTTESCQMDLTRLFSGGFSAGDGHLREPSDIQSYSALACLAIQSNQNDQHGSECIPDFDNAMAPGVRKTFRRLFRENLIKASELVAADPDAGSDLPGCILRAEENAGAIAAMEMPDGFLRELHLILSKRYSPENAANIISFARKYAASETERATYQAMEALLHNLNTIHSRGGARLPLSVINYGTDTSPEGRLVTRCLLSVTDRGLGSGEAAVFPAQIFKVKNGVNANTMDANHDLYKHACAVAAKRYLPQFSFLDTPYNTCFDAATTPQREVAYLSGGGRTDCTRPVYGRGNLSTTTLNLPRIALRANHSRDVFFDELDRKLELVYEQLSERLKLQSERKVRNFPFLMGQGVWQGSEFISDEDTVGDVLKNGSLAIGFIGLGEALIALVGKHHGESEEAQGLGLEIVAHMRRFCDAKANETGIPCLLDGSVRPEAARRLWELDSRQYAVSAAFPSRDRYSDSFCLPGNFAVSSAKKIEIEAPYHELTSGGHLTHVSPDPAAQDPAAEIRRLVDLMRKSGIGCGAFQRAESPSNPNE